MRPPRKPTKPAFAPSRPAITHGEPARAALLRGVETVTAALRPGLGPRGGQVLIAGATRAVAPESLGRGGLIARRTIEIPGAFENMGAMLLRQLAWRMHERTGDGAVTAAVIAQRLLAELMIPVAAGVNPQSIRSALHRLLPDLTAALRAMARPVDGRSQLAALLVGDLTGDEAASVAEALDALGPDATIRVLDSNRSGLTCSYIEGASWNGKCAATVLMNGEATARLVDARIFVTDHPIRSAQDLVPVIEATLQSGVRSLLVIAPEIGDAAIGLLSVNRDRGVMTGALVVQAPGQGDQQPPLLEDVAIVSGGRFVSKAKLDRLTAVSPDDLGFARQVWVTSSMFGLVNTSGAAAARRARIRQLHQEMQRPGIAPAERTRLENRIATLAGVAAEIRVGAATDAERTAAKNRVEAAVALGRASLRDGIVPGGGRSLLAAAGAIHCGDDGDLAGRAARRALRRALAEPASVIARNAGFEPAPVLAGLTTRDCSSVFDVTTGEWVDAWMTGLVDPAGVLVAAMESAVSMAGIAITTDVLIHRREPELAHEP